jgi:serine/threonine-protein kinase
MNDFPHIPGLTFKSLLGKGDSTNVYVAEVTEATEQWFAGQLVAVKVPHAQVAMDEERRKRLQRELEIGEKIRHPNLLRYYFKGETSDGKPYLVMELVRGIDLGRVIELEAPLDAERARRILLQIARGVNELHSFHVIHRDLKPENIMISEGDLVKVMDYGLARLIDTRVQLTNAGTFVGTMNYASPEHFRQEVVLQSDIWSIGVIGYEILTGNPPFKGKSLIELWKAIQLTRSPSVADTNPNVPSPIAHVIERCLEKDYQKRWTETGELISALQEAGN